MTRGRRKAIWRSMDRRKLGDFAMKPEGRFESQQCSFCICKREIPFDDNVMISDHHSPALTLA